MAYYTDIHAALTQSIISLNLGVPIAHENAVFDRTNKTNFIEVNSLFNREDSITKTGFSEVDGIYQITIYSKAGTSVAKSLELVDGLLTYYVNNLILSSGGQQVRVIEVERNEGRNLGGWYVIDVSVVFKSNILR